MMETQSDVLFERIDPRVFTRIQIPGTSIEIEVMLYRGAPANLTPLVIIGSIELPLPPSVEFCERLWAEGFQTVFVRRPGFGRTPGLPNALLTKRSIKSKAPITTEAAMIKLAINTLGLDGIILMGLGTANSICMRLSHLSDRIDSCIFSNPLFHPEIWSVIRPAWLRRMIRQTVLSKSGLRIGVKGLRSVLRRDPIWFFNQFAQKSDGDIEYVTNNQSDFTQAGLLLQKLDPIMFYYDLNNALVDDTRWTPAMCHSINAVILSGQETTVRYKTAIKQESKRLGLPIVFAPSGDLFVPYASPDTLLDILHARGDYRSQLLEDASLSIRSG